MGHAPTHRPMRIDVFEVVRVRNGKIVEHSSVPDRLGALIQFGHVRWPASSPVAV